MTISINNQTTLPDKFVRVLEQELKACCLLFEDVLYAKVFLSAEDQQAKLYKAILRIGLHGQNITITSQASSIKQLTNQLCEKGHKYLIRQTSHRKVV